MCAAFELNSRVVRPSKMVRVWREAGHGEFVWAGFARQEVLSWWKKKGGELVDVPAERFAERSDKTRQLTWDDMPPGHVIRGLIDKSEKTPLLKIVTRESTPEELDRYQHPRMPLIELPLFSAESLGVPEEAPAAQRELF